MTTTLIVPGLHSSGPGHWQTWFEEQIPGTVRVIQRDWDQPNLAEWSSRVRREISRNPGRIVIVAHSFGALAAVQAASDHSDRVAAALLAAPADPHKFGIAELLPADALPFPTALIASTNDPWIALTKAAALADTWGADFINIGAAGHINTEAGFGPWSEGIAIYERLKRAAQASTNAEKSIVDDLAVRRRIRWAGKESDGKARAIELARAIWTPSHERRRGGGVAHGRNRRSG